jgi:hypothetical protein
MKKIFTLILVAAGLSFNAASAQNRNDRYNDQDRYQVNQPNDNRNYNGRQQSKDYGYNNHRDRNNDYNRQAEVDRRSQQCDSRNDGYSDDRRPDRYESNRRMEQAGQERQQKAKAFGNGMVVGGIAAIVLGVLIGSGGR